MKVVETGRNAILVCEAAGDPPPSVYWVKDTLRLEPDPRYSILDQGQLRGKNNRGVHTFLPIDHVYCKVTKEQLCILL